MKKIIQPIQVAGCVIESVEAERVFEVMETVVAALRKNFPNAYGYSKLVRPRIYYIILCVPEILPHDQDSLIRKVRAILEEIPSSFVAG